ncbi:MAG: glycosyltransferase family 4 protein [Bacteroidetes bacterium]|nr:glycosyltransferase family 4 protein [Bacteroidota bacterium]
MPVLGRNWPSFFPLDLWTNHYFVKKHVSEIIYEINPDIIHLHGAENTFHSNAILQFKNKYPVFITVQGILSNTIYASKSKHLRTVRRIKNEKMIYKTFKHFGYRTETMGKDITNLNPYAKLHWHNYPMKKIELIKSEKQFDLVYFARITKEKGIEDLLKAVAIIKKTKKNISLCVIGAGKTDELKVLANKLNIGQNVYWAGFLPTQKDVHKMASTARITVLPVYSEIISGTIVESLFLKLPVIAYDVGSIHEVNKEDEIITLVPRGDVQRLSHAIIGLLNDENQREKKADMGYKRAKEMFGASNDEIRNQLLKAYELVIHDFHGK